MPAPKDILRTVGLTRKQGGRKVSFEEAGKVPCPKCGATTGSHCLGVKGAGKGKNLITYHNERLQAARD